MASNIGNNSSTKSLTPEDQALLRKALKEMDDSLTRAVAEKTLQKEIINRIYTDVGVSRKLFRRMAKAHHRSDFDMEVEEDRDFEATYETVMKVNK
jgi:hypothetical protein